MYDLACSNDGTYYNVEEPNGLPNDMIQYLIVLIYTRTSLAPAWFARHARSDFCFEFVSLRTFLISLIFQLWPY